MDRQTLKQELIDFIKDLVIIVISVIIIKSFLIEPFQISWPSMFPSYYDKEFIIVDRFSYLDIPSIKKWKIERWDVIVFKPGVSRDKEYFIKRVIAVWWDTVDIDGGKVYLKKSWEKDFVELDEKYLSNENRWKTFVAWWNERFEVPIWEFFVMWDNRNHSNDSRTCFYSSCKSTLRDAYVTKDNITWKVWLDLGYFNFRTFSFSNPTLNILTYPKWFSSPSEYEYN